MMLATAVALGAPSSGQAQDAPDSFADLAEQVMPAAVNISTTQTIEREQRRGLPDLPEFPPGSPFEDFFREFFERQQLPGPQRATSLGSGFIIDAELGYVVTNNHVIADADEINVILHDDTNLSAEVVGTDDRTDLAVLRVETDGHDLRAVEWGDSDTVRVGDWVLAVGNPFGLGGTVTAGILSARARDIQAGPYDDFLQTDASINRGNSGGPMFNLDGRVIGINTAIFSPSGGSVGIGFAIPASLAQPVVEQIIEHGRTRRGWIGVRIQDVNEEIAESLGLEEPRGALVASVTPSGPADEAGIRAGDIILEFNDREVSEMRRLPRIVAETDVGATVDVTIWRQGEEVDTEVLLGELEEAEQAGLLQQGVPQPGDEPGNGVGEVEVLGLTLTAIDSAIRRDFDLPDDQAGVIVTEVSGDSEAAVKGMRPGDIIVEVNQEEVNDPEDVIERIDAAGDAGRGSVLLLVDRGGDLRFVALSIADR